VPGPRCWSTPRTRPASSGRPGVLGGPGRLGRRGPPVRVLTSAGQVNPFYEALSRRRIEVAPVCFDGAGYLRIAAAPYNTEDDYDRLAGGVRELLDGEGLTSGTPRRGGEPRGRPASPL
jgi:hypothetical protein